MGRRRKSLKHLPPRMRLRHGSYFYDDKRAGAGRGWINLGRDYGLALVKWAELEGRPRDQPRTVAHAIGHYLETEGKALAASTREGYARGAARLIAVFGAMDLSDLEPAAVYRYLREHGNVQANRDVALLSVVYKWARAWGWHRGENPCAKVPRNKEKPRERYVTDEELSRLLDHAGNAMVRLIIELAYLIGQRQGDVLDIRVEDIDDADGVFIQQGKTGKQQLFEWSPATKRVVEQALAIGRRGKRVFLFESNRGERYTGGGFRTLWRRIKLAAGLPDVQFRDLRAKTASDDEFGAQHRLGHQDGRVTKRHYIRRASQVKPIR
ncbi:tyrosine-type recombinase/integrase [Tahibacter harae]|uniref:Tyrosine-type recombinase/integrase n=1 Tax=Tahibacter harae TaxID=2963937 RepID=A0ABT1QS37_9GAMM|nr:tyrosine-type recombinase/integrase [Tahibacter harae]MCQ4165098.1 tyrosine-type recombinase/integrase [Tahibacter harae]